MIQALTQPAVPVYCAASLSNPANFETVIIRYQTPLYHFVYSLVQDKELAKDLVNQTFFLAYRNLVKQPRSSITGGYQEGHFSAWLYTIARNQAFGELRQRKFINFFSINQITKKQGNLDEGDFEQQLTEPGQNLEEQIVLRLDLLEVLRKIKPARLVPLLLSQRGFSYQEISEQTGLSIGSIKAQIFRVRRQLRKALETCTS
jgi:RNA polymerase sigma-70 factor (ECF subfamily)